MPPKLRIALFFITLLLVTGGIHLYLWRRLVRDTSLPRSWRRALTATLLALLVALLSVFVLRRLLPQDTGRVVLYPIYLWMGTGALLFIFLLPGDLVRLSMRLGGWLRRGRARPESRQESLHAEGAPRPEGAASGKPRLERTDRRVFFSRAFGGAVTGGTMGATLLSSRSALAMSNIATARVTIHLPKLPRALDNFRLVQISDLHIGPTLGRSWLAGVVARVNALEPDLIAITGDLVDGYADQMRHEIEPLRALRARHGVFFTTGNHEYYSGAVSWCKEIARLGVRVLRNERVMIGSPTASFYLAGIDDHNARGMAPGHGADLPRALTGRDPSKPVVLMAHQPRQVFEAAEHGVELQLSGHTHGGQIWPFHYLVRLQQPYLKGLVRHGDTQLYVSQGTGFWGPPMRIGSRAEITELTLRATSSPRPSKVGGSTRRS